MLSVFIVSERPFAFHCGPDLGGNNIKYQKLVEGSTSVSQIYHLSIPASLNLPHWCNIGAVL